MDAGSNPLSYFPYHAKVFCSVVKEKPMTPDISYVPPISMHCPCDIRVLLYANVWAGVAFVVLRDSTCTGNIRISRSRRIGRGRGEGRMIVC